MGFLTDFFDKVPMMGIFTSFAAYFVGMKFPDWDFKMKLRHRSILTHSPLILMVFIKVYEESPNEIFRYFLMGFSIALSLHFIFDLYPRGWGGGSLIKIPVFKYTCNIKTSKMILLFSIVVSSLVAVVYTINLMEFYYLCLVGVITVIKDTVKEEKLFRPLFSFSLFIFIIGCIKYRELFLSLKDSTDYVFNQISMFF